MSTVFSPNIIYPISPLFLPSIAAFLLLSLATYKTPVILKPLFFISFSMPIGLGMCSLIMFWSYVIGGQYAKGLTLLILASFILIFGLAVIFLVLRTKKSRTNNAAQEIIAKSKLSKFQIALTLLGFSLIVFCLFHFFEFFLTRITWNPVGGWDARYVWNLKARFYFRSPENWTNMFSGSIASWSLRDYPLMLPGSVAWGWNWAGREILVWPNIVSLTFFLSTVLLALWYLASISSWWYALLGATFLLTMPALQTWTAALYADVPLCFFITASALCLLQSVRLNSFKLVWLSGFLAGLSIWTKNEGIFFTIWMICVLIILTISKHSDRRLKRWLLLCFLAGLALPALTALYQKLIYGGFGAYLQTNRTLRDYTLIFLDYRRAQFIAASFLAFKINSELWQGLWIFFYSGIFLYPVLRQRPGFVKYSWILLTLVFLMDAGYFFIFQITPIELRSHIQWSLSRLLIHHGVLALLFTFEVFSPSYRKNQLA